jgi:hypothetical protein
MWSAIELNVAIICASLLVMKPLFARFVPAIVSEQPMSAREDARLWAGLTGLRHLMDIETGEDEEQEKVEEDEEEEMRRDTAVAMSVAYIPAVGKIRVQNVGACSRRKSW